MNQITALLAAINPEIELVGALTAIASAHLCALIFFLRLMFVTRSDHNALEIRVSKLEWMSNPVTDAARSEKMTEASRDLMRALRQAKEQP